MVEQVDTTSGNLNGHHPGNRNKAAEESWSILTPVSKQLSKPRVMFPLMIVAAVQGSSKLYNKLQEHGIVVEIPSTVDTYTLALTMATAALIYLVYYFVSTPGRTLMLDFACFKPDDSTMVTRKFYVDRAKECGFYTERSLEFMEKVLFLSGLGDETYAPPSTLCLPVDRSLKASHAEAQTVLFGVCDELFSHNTVKPKDIDILVVNCSMYSPVPSLAAMIINHYKMRKDIDVYNLGGMGCSAGLISIDLAHKLLQGRRNSYALVLSTEVISAMFGYSGNQRSMMVGNCLFRTGSAAVLLSNRRADRWRAKYELQKLVRTHNAADDASYKCVASTEDEVGNIGISLSRDLMRAAGAVLKDNITTLAPHILPWTEKLKFAINFISMKLNNNSKDQQSKSSVKPYMPNFTKGVSHFVVHPGGRAILDGVAEKLDLDEWYMEPSRMTLHRFGNTSSSSVWYALAYLEAKGRVHHGDTVWQIALGSGLKCNSAVWKSLRSTQDGPSANCWAQFIDKYPVELATTLPPHLTTPKPASET